MDQCFLDSVPGGRNEVDSWGVRPGIVRYAFADVSSSLDGESEVSLVLRRGSRMRHHHFTRPVSSKTCFFLFSMLRAKRYWSCALANKLMMVWTPCLQRCLRRYCKNAVVTPFIGDDVLEGRLRRYRKPLESAFEMKRVVDETVV